MRRCDNCWYAKKWGEMSDEEKRLFLISVYAEGVPYEEWGNYRLCTLGEFVKAVHKDDVCERWEPRGDEDAED